MSLGGHSFEGLPAPSFLSLPCLLVKPLGAAVLPFAVGAIAQAKGVQVLQPIVLALLALILIFWCVLPGGFRKRGLEEVHKEMEDRRAGRVEEGRATGNERAGKKSVLRSVGELKKRLGMVLVGA